MRILFLSSQNPRYVRNLVLNRALHRDHEVVELSSDSTSPVWHNLSVGLRYLLAGRDAFDLIVIGFPGHLLVPWVRLWMRRPHGTPILFDPFVSVYDTFCLDRQRFGPRSIPGRLAFALDRWSCRLADRILLDTQAHGDFFIQTFGLPADKVAVAYVGCDERLFAPRAEPAPTPPFRVFTYTSFLRLHGVEQVLHAAQRLSDREDISFTIAGAGAHLAAMQRQARDLRLENVAFPGWVPFDQLPARIAEADLCLGGHFSAVPKAARVISTKTFQFLAMHKPTIVADNPASREVFCHGEHVWMVPMGDPEMLAGAIRTLADDRALRDRIATGGYEVFQQRFTTQAIADQLAPVLQEAACASAS